MASAPPHASLAELVYSLSHCFPVENVMVLDVPTALPWPSRSQNTVVIVSLCRTTYRKNINSILVSSISQKPNLNTCLTSLAYHPIFVRTFWTVLASFEDDIEDARKLGRCHGTKLNTGLYMPGLGSLSSTGGKTGESCSFTHCASGLSKGRRRGTRLITPPAGSGTLLPPREEACRAAGKQRRNAEKIRRMGHKWQIQQGLERFSRDCNHGYQCHQFFTSDFGFSSFCILHHNPLLLQLMFLYVVVVDYYTVSVSLNIF